MGAAVCTGNAPDVGVPEVVRHLAADGETRAIGLFLEGVGEGTALMEALREAREREVGVAVLKVGRTSGGRAVVASHARWSAATRPSTPCARASALCALTTTTTCSRRPTCWRRPRARGAAWPWWGLGGMNAALADVSLRRTASPATAGARPRTVAGLGEVVPDFGAAMNPVDISSAVVANPGGLGRALGVLAGDPAVEGVVVVVGDHPPRLSELLADGIAAAAADLDGRVVAQWSAGSLSEPGMTRLARAGIPVFTSPERCMRAVARAMGADVAPPPPAAGEGALPPGPLRDQGTIAVPASNRATLACDKRDLSRRPSSSGHINCTRGGNLGRHIRCRQAAAPGGG